MKAFCVLVNVCRTIVFLFFFQFSSDSIALHDHKEKLSDSSSICSTHLFESDEILRMTIFSDFSSIMKDRGDDRTYHKGFLFYVCNGDTINRKVKLRTRGNFRRDPKNCKYPPISVKLGRLKTEDPVFVDQSKLKLVTQCQLENYVLLEYIAYRIYNLITDQSFRVRLAKITYADLESEKTHFTRYAFFIENEKALASRINAEIYKANVVQYFLKRSSVITMAMFQYMIGNDDWYVTSKHNVSVLELDNHDLIAIPYDFDWSKLVDADYTKPAGVPNYMLKERRIYKGLCLEDKDFKEQVKIFNSRKQYILNFIGSSVDDLKKQDRQRVIKYIEQFYEQINNPSSLKYLFQSDKCISEPNLRGK